MDEAEHLADRVAVIVRGRLVALGTPEELGAGDRGTALVSFRLPAEVDPADLPALDGKVAQNGTDWEFETAHPTKSLHELTSWAVEHDIEVPSLSVGRPSLEDTYLALVAAHDADGATEEAAR
jgi:ABC-2 type transport system ATP-binding protein